MGRRRVHHDFGGGLRDRPAGRRAIPVGVDELGAVAASLVVASVLLLPLAALSAPDHIPSTLSLTAVAALGIACTALALYLYFYLINVAGASRASVVAYINPAVAAVIGVLVLHEPFGLGRGRSGWR